MKVLPLNLLLIFFSLLIFTDAFAQTTGLPFDYSKELVSKNNISAVVIMQNWEQGNFAFADQSTFKTIAYFKNNGSVHTIKYFRDGQMSRMMVFADNDCPRELVSCNGEDTCETNVIYHCDSAGKLSAIECGKFTNEEFEYDSLKRIVRIAKTELCDSALGLHDLTRTKYFYSISGKTEKEVISQSSGVKIKQGETIPDSVFRFVTTGIYKYKNGMLISIEHTYTVSSSAPTLQNRWEFSYNKKGLPATVKIFNLSGKKKTLMWKYKMTYYF